MSALLRGKASRLLGSSAPRVALIAFALAVTLMRWDAVTGYTAMPRFGERFADRRLAVLRDLAIAPSPGDGYDGQWYAQIAVDPRVTSPAVVAALDKPAYRARRILLPVVAHLLGGRDPWTVLQVFALLHIAAWLAFALVLWRLIPPTGWRATAAWAGAALGTGALDSMRMTLTDLPAALLLTLALMAAARGRAGISTVWMLAAGFVREVSLLGILVVRHASAGRTFLLRSAAALPVLAWCLWLAWRVPGVVGHEGNISWPGVAFASRLWTNASLIAGGDHNPQWWFGIAGGMALAAQSWFVLRRVTDIRVNALVALGVPFALLFWVIGADPWIDYRAVARDCLPMTLAFNLLWYREGKASPFWLLANVPVVDGLLRLTWP